MNILKLFTMNQAEVNEYFRLRREERFNRIGAKATHIPFHNFMHYILIYALKVIRLFDKRKLTVIADKRKTRKTKPTVYACTHIGANDIESVFEAIYDPCYLFLGDPEKVYRNIDGLMLWLNGVIALDTRSKPDRAIAKERAVSLLKQGGSLMIFPEGAWNISENEPAMKMYSGAALMALESGADIVPIAVERYDKHYYVVIGEELHYVDFAHHNSKSLTSELRDVLSSLKWEIWEYLGVHSRAEIASDYAETVFFPMFADVQGSTLQDVYETRYRDKNITEPTEVFAHLNHIHPTKQTAFLFNKRLK